MEIGKVAVLGAGTMGGGIAQVCAQVGCEVALYDVKQGLADKGLERIKKFLQKGVDRGKVGGADRDAALARIRTTANLRDAVLECDLVVEAAPEDLELKRIVLGNASGLAGKQTILATNTSSLPISAIAAGNPAAARIIGMHFFNPVPLMKLLEIVVGKETSGATAATANAFGQRLGKEVITVKDSPGFASSRLGICIAMEAIRLLENGVASATDIDAAMIHGYGHPIGPLRLTDLVGLDVRVAIAEHLAGALHAPQFEPPALLKKLVREGKLGKKTGEGFYKWDA